MSEIEKKQKPIVIKDNQTGEPLYTLEFNRKTVAMAEHMNFVVDEVRTKPLTTSQMLFFLSFQMHHPKMKKEKTDELFEQFGGVNNTDLFVALVKLYNAATESIDTGDEKNAKYALVM